MRETGIKIVPVHYRGAPPAVTDLLGGHADFMFSDAPFFLEHIKSGKLVPLAVGTPERSRKSARGADHSGTRLSRDDRLQHVQPLWPARNAGRCRQKLNALVLKELRDPEVQSAFSTQAATPAGATPAAFAAQIQAEADRWLPIVQSGGDKAN